MKYFEVIEYINLYVTIKILEKKTHEALRELFKI